MEKTETEAKDVTEENLQAAESLAYGFDDKQSSA